jgi:hypothetical protein
LVVDSYVAMEAAVPLSCYFAPVTAGEADVLPGLDALIAAENENPTPNEYGDLGYRGFLRTIIGGITGNFVNYHNLNDFWLAVGKTRLGVKVDWVKNQRKFKPDDRSLGSAYQYVPPDPLGQRCYLRTNLVGGRRPVDDIHEALSYVARSRTRALGAEPKNGTPAPPQGQPVDLNGDYGFGLARYDHSGQFQRNIQAMYDRETEAFPIPVYRRLLNDLRILEP